MKNKSRNSYVEYLLLALMLVCVIVAGVIFFSDNGDKKSANTPTQIVEEEPPTEDTEQIVGELEEEQIEEEEESNIIPKPSNWSPEMIADAREAAEEAKRQEELERQQQEAAESTPAPPANELDTNIVYSGPTESTLMIGDSRTEGIRLYSQLSDVAYFSDTGASIYNIWDKTLNVSGAGYLTLRQTLETGNYKNICILLGINEIGYDLNTTYQRFASLVSEVKNYQPQARIFIQANLHVTQSFSDSNASINNPRINQFNALISTLHDGQTIFYIDANPLFDDVNGHMSAQYSGDGVHLYASCYIAWGQWLMSQLQ